MSVAPKEHGNVCKKHVAFRKTEIETVAKAFGARSTSFSVTSKNKFHIGSFSDPPNFD